MAIYPVSAGSPQVMSSASMPMPPQKKMESIYHRIDTSNAGSISQTQFSSAFENLNPPYGFQKLGADAIWSQLDPNNTGSVSHGNFVSSMTDIVSQIRNSN